MGEYRKSRRREPGRFYFTVMLNLITAGFVLVTSELTVRLFSRTDASGQSFLGTTLLPKSWTEVRNHNRQMLESRYNADSYLVYDDLLGWRIGPSRKSANGLYFSSQEGLRSPTQGITFSSGPRHRIAIVGDSYTFAQEVSYEESWGHQLERLLGPDFQVLNFGVEGYSVGQAYLHYRRDVQPWRPDIVIFGVIDHDLARTLSVYSFVTFPHWRLPFAKPRFVVNGSELVTINTPLISPEAIIGTPRIADLPAVDYDLGYNENDWQWRAYHPSYLVRFLISRFPRWPISRPEISDQALRSLNGALFRSFIAMATEQRSAPIIVYFPSQEDPDEPDESVTGESLAKIVLESHGLPFVDLTSCITAVDVSKRFLAWHYSAEANLAVARCLRDAVLARIDQQQHTDPSR
jgi:hypothetical protein